MFNIPHSNICRTKRCWNVLMFEHYVHLPVAIALDHCFFVCNREISGNFVHIIAKGHSAASGLLLSTIAQLLIDR